MRFDGEVGGRGGGREGGLPMLGLADDLSKVDEVEGGGGRVGGREGGRAGEEDAVEELGGGAFRAGEAEETRGREGRGGGGGGGGGDVNFFVEQAGEDLLLQRLMAVLF